MGAACAAYMPAMIVRYQPFTVLADACSAQDLNCIGSLLLQLIDVLPRKHVGRLRYAPQTDCVSG